MVRGAISRKESTVLSATPNPNPCLHQLFDHLSQYGAVSLCMFLLPAEKRGRGSGQVTIYQEHPVKKKRKKKNFYLKKKKNIFEESVASDFGLFQIFHIKPRLLSKWVTVIICAEYCNLYNVQDALWDFSFSQTARVHVAAWTTIQMLGRELNCLLEPRQTPGRDRLWWQYKMQHRGYLQWLPPGQWLYSL